MVPTWSCYSTKCISTKKKWRNDQGIKGFEEKCRERKLNSDFDFLQWRPLSHQMSLATHYIEWVEEGRGGNASLIPLEGRIGSLCRKWGVHRIRSFARAFFSLLCILWAKLLQKIILKILALDSTWSESIGVFAILGKFWNFGLKQVQQSHGHEMAGIKGFHRSQMCHGPD